MRIRTAAVPEDVVAIPETDETGMDERAGALLSGFCSDTIRLAVVP